VVSAVDASAVMAEHARHRLTALPGSDPARWSVNAVRLDEHLPFDDGFFDGAVSPLVLHYMRDWRPALREIRRVLVPGGWLLFSTHHPFADADRYETRNYLATEAITDHWEWVGHVQFFRRSFTEIFASLADTGFTIGKVVEPIPSERFRETNPESYERIMRIPEFLIVLAFLQ
jgi:SAM-dependent methyltransferase